MVDISCRLKVVFKNGRDKFLTDGDSLTCTIAEEEIS